MGQVIDTHAHVVPERLLVSLAEKPIHGFSAERTERGWVVTVPGTGPTRPIGARMHDPVVRRDWIAEVGIDRQILSAWMDVQTGVFDKPETGRAWMARLNDALFDLGTAGERVLAGVDLADGEKAAGDLVRLAGQAEVAGVVISTNPLAAPLHDVRMESFWAAAARERIPVVLHPPTCGPSAELSTISRLGNVHGRLVDNTVAVSELVLHGVLDRHPDLRLVLVHGGGFLPFQAGRLDGGYRTGEARAAELSRGKPSAYLTDFYYDTVGLTAPAIDFLTSVAGTAKVMLGTDFPFALGDPRPVDTVRRTELGADTITAILGENAESLFGRSA